MREPDLSVPTAVIISKGWPHCAYDIVRSLHIGGIASAVASSRPNDIAFDSRYCNGKLVLPDFESCNYQEILTALQDLSVRCREKPVLYYISDPELWFVWQFRDQLKPFYRFLLPPNNLLEHLFNKALFAKLAAVHDMPIPKTTPVGDVAMLRSIIDTIDVPCILKPAYSQDWIWETEDQLARFGPYKNALRRFDSKKELLEFCGALPLRSSGLVIQSYIDGRDETITSFHGYFDERSRCLGYFLGRKIRTYPPHTGGSVYIQTIHNSELAQLSIEYLQRIRFQGIVKIDYKWNEQAKEFSILEINPRFNLWELLGAYAGVNLSLIAYRHQRGERIDLQNEYCDDARLLFFKQDFRAYLTGYRRTKEWTLVAYLKSLTAKKYYRVYDPGDPMPLFHSATDFIKRNALRLLGQKPARWNPHNMVPRLEMDNIPLKKVVDPNLQEATATKEHAKKSLESS